MKPAEPLPTAPGALPLLGHVLPLLHDPLAFLNSLPAQGDLVRIRLGPYTVIMVCDPEFTRQVLLDDHTYDKGGPLFDRARELLGDGLGTCPHGRHRRQRRLTQPAFRPARFPTYAQNMAAEIVAVTSGWRDGQILDIPTEMMRLTSRATMETMFSGALPVLALQHALDDLSTVLGGVYRRAVVPQWLNRLPTPVNRRYDHARARLRHTIDGIIADRRTNGADHGDLLSALLTIRDPEGQDGSGHGQGLTDTEINDQVITFFAAGTETTATTLAWALHLLGQQPDIQQRLHTEADTILAGGPAHFEHLPKLDLTGHVITEALRLYPPVWILTRTVATDTRLGAHSLPADTIIAYSPYLIHHRPDFYDNPEHFNPDRWDITRHPPPPRNAFIPFAAGARKCIGDRFAIIEATLALATITSHWHLQPLPNLQVRPAFGLTLRPHTLRMRVVARTAAEQPSAPTSS